MSWRQGPKVTPAAHSPQCLLGTSAAHPPASAAPGTRSLVLKAAHPVRWPRGSLGHRHAPPRVWLSEGGTSASDLPAPLPGRCLWPSLAWGWQQVPWAWTFSRGQRLTAGTPETRRNCQGLEALPPGPLGLELCPGASVLLSSTQKHPCQGAFPAGPPGASLHCILNPQDGKVNCASPTAARI